MNIRLIFQLLLCSVIIYSCNDKDNNYYTTNTSKDFVHNVDQFADLAILRYQVPGWDELTLKEKKLVYYLTQAGLAGRDIFWDQKYRHNIEIRVALENIYKNFSGDKSSEDWKEFEIYLKRVWFSNGIHHHYSNDKIKPNFTIEYFNKLIESTNTDLKGEAYNVIFNDADTKMVNKSKGVDNVLESAVNFYGPDVTASDVTNFYSNLTQADPEKPLSFGLNSKLVKENGELKELVYKLDGLYGNAIKEIIKWLKLATEVAENEKQAEALKILVKFYEIVGPKHK